MERLCEIAQKKKGLIIMFYSNKDVVIFVANDSKMCF